MRRVVITLAASLVLTFATALPMRALGLTAVTVSCGDDTFSATVDADTLDALTHKIGGMHHETSNRRFHWRFGNWPDDSERG